MKKTTSTYHNSSALGVMFTNLANYAAPPFFRSRCDASHIEVLTLTGHDDWVREPGNAGSSWISVEPLPELMGYLFLDI